MNISGEIVRITLVVVVVVVLVVVEEEMDAGNRIGIRMVSQKRENGQLDVSVLRQGPNLL